MEEAAYLIEGRPPGGWGSLVTKEHLDLRLAALDQRSGALDRRIDELEERSTLRLEAVEHRLSTKLAELSSSVDRRLRAQTWIMTGTLLTGIGAALALGRAV